VREVTDAFLLHYNTERPNQAISCGNRPPRVAYPELPTLLALSEFVKECRVFPPGSSSQRKQAGIVPAVDLCLPQGMPHPGCIGCTVL
jgi:hypothetical protein